jgi:surfeit locus 1 family protein
VISLLRQFKPSLIGTIATLALIPLFIHLGMWQFNKAMIKQRLQDQYEVSAKQQDAALPSDFTHLDDLRYKHVLVQGEYLTQYQILLDNQVEGEVAGYHVITPLRLHERNQVLLIDRGWVPALPNHTDLPAIETPAGEQEVSGQIWVPSQKFYTLKNDDNHTEKWQAVWQNMDMKSYAKAVPFEVVPVVLRMSPKNAGGFVRNWVRPDDRIQTHLSYAYQWFGFAMATLGIYLFVSLRRGKALAK